MPDHLIPTDPMQIVVQQELGRGANLLQAHAALEARRAAGVPAGTYEKDADAPEGSIPLRELCERHPEYQGDYWADCEALYKGGPDLLRAPKVMDRLFPRHNAELDAIYEDRRRRAFYLNYAGTIVDSLVAGLEGDPVRLSPKDATAEDPGELDQWWSDWQSEVTAPGADLEHRRSLQGMACDTVRAAMIKQSAWILCDLPAVAPEVAEQLETVADVEAAGVRNPYLCLLEADAVVDWGTDDDGVLEWATVWTVERRRGRPGTGGAVMRHTWTIWDREGWARYALDINPQRPPRPETPVPKVAEGPHDFGRVPLIRFKLPAGLWAMGKLESLAREHFNKRCAVSWAEYKSLFAVLYEFLAPEGAGVKVVSAAGRDPERAHNQIRGQGWTQTRGDKDRAEYVGPDVAPFKEARESCAELMREMHRVTSSMAASANQDSAALQRSGDSKEQDRADTKVVLEALGQRTRDLVQAIVELVAAGRGEDDPGIDVKGLEAFDVDSVVSRIAQAVELFAGVPILSATFKRRLLEQLYSVVLGDNADPQDLEEIRKELAKAISMEDVAAEAAIAAGTMAPAQPDPAPGEEVDDPDEDAPPRRGRPAPQPGKISTGTGKLAPK